MQTFKKLLAKIGADTAENVPNVFEPFGVSAAASAGFFSGAGAQGPCETMQNRRKRC